MFQLAASRSVCLTAGASGQGRGTRINDSEKGLDLSHLIRLYRGGGTVHSDSSSCKTVSQSRPSLPIPEVILVEVPTDPVPVPVESGV